MVGFDVDGFIVGSNEFIWNGWSVICKDGTSVGLKVAKARGGEDDGTDVGSDVEADVRSDVETVGEIDARFVEGEEEEEGLLVSGKYVRWGLYARQGRPRISY